jgi:phosphomannomutase
VGFNHIAEKILTEDILIGGEESGGISFRGHIPEGDGILMGLLLVEIVSNSNSSLYEMVEELLENVGPAFYERKDMRLQNPISKPLMTKRLLETTPASVGGENVIETRDTDGVKYILSDESWLLIRPSGTEPVLRVYAEGRSKAMVKELLLFGERMASSSA